MQPLANLPAMPKAPRPYGFSSGVTLRAFRESPATAAAHGGAPYHAIFPDGTRKPLREMRANALVRGHYARHDKWNFFAAPYTRRPRGQASPADTGDVGLVTVMVEDRSIFWREKEHRGVLGLADECVRLVRMDDADGELPIASLSTVLEHQYGVSGSSEEMPVSKFLELFDINKSFFSTADERKGMSEDVQHRRPMRIPVGVPYPFAVSILVLLKCKFKFARLHLLAQERKFAPSGLGFKRLLESDTAKAMPKKPRQECDGAGIELM